MKKILSMIYLFSLVFMLAACSKEQAGGSSVSYQADEETVTYNGITRKKSELCDQTLHYLELSEEEKLFSSYLPPEFLILDETWGVTIAAENVTPTALTLVCTQSGGDPTGALQTGSWFVLEKWTKENGWSVLPPLCEDGWDAIAYIIPMDETIEWKINWEHIYGELPKGKYRIGKEIMDFRTTGQYDTAIYYAEFEIQRN